MNRKTALVVLLTLISGSALAKPCEAPPDVTDMTMDQLEQLRKDYVAGKRDDRDGYIILNQIHFFLQAKRTAHPEELERVSSALAVLTKKRPELGNLQDFRLSDAIACANEVAQARIEAQKRAEAWIPEDSVPTTVFGQGKHAVLVYQFKLAFLELPDDVEVQEIRGNKVALFRGKTKLDPTTIAPKKTITFKRSIRVPKEGSSIAYRSLLVCTSALGSGYSARTPKEESILGALGQSGWKPWINKAGTYEHFYGVVSLTGELLHRFEVKEEIPDTVVAPVGIRPDGTLAAIMIGEERPGPEGEGTYVGNPREVWIWRASGAVEKKKIPSPSTTNHDLRRMLHLGTL